MNANVPNGAVKLLKTKTDNSPADSKVGNLLKIGNLTPMKAVNTLKLKLVLPFALGRHAEHH
jgi:hypothetical protein